MRVRASAGAASFHQRETLETHLRKARAHIEQLRDEALDTSQSARQKAARARAARERAARVERALALLPEAEATLERRKEPAAKARVSTTDPEARVMKMADGGFRPALNVEVAADTATHLIVGVDVVNIGNDMGQLPPMLDQIEKRLGRLPKEMLVDGGFPSEGSLEAAHARGVTLYAPSRNQGNRSAIAICRAPATAKRKRSGVSAGAPRRQKTSISSGAPPPSG